MSKEEKSQTGRSALTMSDQLTELRGKLHLGECERKTLYAWMENEREDNEWTILKLRQETKQRRVALAESINADEKVIENVFANKRQEKLSLKRHTADEALAAMDQKACERVKSLNNLRYNRMAREQNLTDMGLELQQMGRVCAKKPNQSMEQRVRCLENSLDKAGMKYETAYNIGVQYENISKKMKEDSLTFPARLDTMEQAVIEIHQELNNLRKMNKESQLSRDQERTNLAKLEKEVQGARRQRDNKLTNLKKDIESRRLEFMSKAEKRSKQTTAAYSESQHEKEAALHTRMKAENQFLLMRYESLFAEIKHSTGLTKLSEFVERFNTQGDKLKRLMERTAELQQLVARLKREKDDLLKQIVELKYSGEEHLSIGQSSIEDKTETCENKATALDELKERMHEKGHLLVDIKTGLKTIFEKLINIKLPPPVHNRLTGDTDRDFEILRDKYDLLLGEVDGFKEHNNLDVTKLYQALEEQLGAGNIRVQLNDSSHSFQSEFEYELHDTDEVLTRDDIKNSGQLLIDSKVKPKRKRAKAKL